MSPLSATKWCDRTVDGGLLVIGDQPGRFGRADPALNFIEERGC
jgi:hypothetical protein